MNIILTIKTLKRIMKKAIAVTITFFIVNTNAAIPTGYYDTADPASSISLRNSLHEIIDDHQRFPYTSTSTDTWDILETADQDPDVSGNVITIYKNASYAKQGGGNSFYNREHSWPKSYGFPNDGSTNSAYTDTHHLFIADSGYNSSRSNKPYANCAGCNEKITEFNNNRGGTASESNWTAGSFSAGSWETWNARKGDVARALLYMDVRYEGGTHGVTGVAEPDLILTDDRALIDASNTASNISVAYMGLRSVLIQWHKDDPVDNFERRHTDTVYGFQGNRNPFIDHPEYVTCVFENVCSDGGGDTTPPAAPTGLNATGGSGLVALSWTPNSETDLAGYNIYRSQVSGTSYVKINSSLVTSASYNDTNVSELTTYYYVITGVDTSLNESDFSNEAFATTQTVIIQENVAWINEFHYDNSSTDVGEFIEIAGTAGTDLSGWSLIGYNGNGGTTYSTVNLSGVISDQQNGFGAISFAIVGLQNGAPDGMALVDNNGVVIQFLSYEGTLVATNGVANSMTSVDVGVAETSSTPVGYSLQLTGTGSQYSDFSWQAPSSNSAGQINSGQSFDSTPPPQNQLPTASFSYQCSSLTCSFDASTSSDPDGSIVSYQWDFGDTTQATGITSDHIYDLEGSYNVTLTVTDNDGAIAQASQSINVTEVVTEPTLFKNNTVTPIPDKSTITSNINVTRSGLAGTVAIAVNITHTYRGDIGIILHAPDGTTYVLKVKSRGDSSDNVIATYTVNVSGNAQGNWTLEVTDHFNRDTGQLNAWSVQF